MIHLIPGSLCFHLDLTFATHHILQILGRITGDQLPSGYDHDIITDFPYFRKNVRT